MSGDLKTTDSIEDAMSIYLKVSDLRFSFIKPLYNVALLDVISNQDEKLMVDVVVSRAIALCISSSLSRRILVRIDSSSFDESKRQCKRIRGYSLLTAISDLICVETFVDDFESVATFIKSVRVLSTKYGINKHGYPYIISIRVQKSDLSMPLVIKFMWSEDLRIDMMEELQRFLDK